MPGRRAFRPSRSYNVLLTRGLRGVYLHSTDAETQRFLETLV